MGWVTCGLPSLAASAREGGWFGSVGEGEEAGPMKGERERDWAREEEEKEKKKGVWV